MNVPQWAYRLGGTLRLNVVLRGDSASQRPVGLLLLVIHLHLGEVERALLHGRIAAARLVRRDQDVRKRILQEFLLVLAGLPASQNRGLSVLAGGASENQFRGGLVGAHYEVEVLHGHFARSAAAAGPHGTRVGLAPGKGRNLDFVLVRLILGLALDTVNLQKIIYCCHSFPPCMFGYLYSYPDRAAVGGSRTPTAPPPIHKLIPSSMPAIPLPGAAKPRARRVGSADAGS